MQKLSKILKNTALLCLLSIVFSCSNKDKIDSDVKLYNDALEYIKVKRFVSAKDNLEKLETEYPYSEFAARSEILNSFINYITEEYAIASDQANKFIKIRPANDNIEYMYFLRAISLRALVRDRYREAETAIKAKSFFKEILERYPDSKYHEVAIAEIDFLNERIASHQMEVARFYQFNLDYLAAIISYQELLNQFPKSKFSAEVNFRLAEIYFALGLQQEFLNNAAIIENNYQDTLWFDKINELKSLT